MTAAELKASILDRAVRGLLVPQDPSEGNAADLFSRDGRARSPSAPQPIADPPYDLPQGWAWKRLGEVISLTSGQDLKPSEYNDKRIGIPYITGASNIKDGTVIINRWTNSPRAIAERGDLLLTCKGTVGAMAFLTEPKVHIARQIMGIRAPNTLDPKYIRTFIETSVTKLQKNAKSLIPGIARADLLNLPIPLPPLAEQKRIVAKIEELMPLVEEYGKAETELAALNDNFPTALRKSILQYAVEGKLLPKSDEWKNVKIKDIANMYGGFAFKSSDYKRSGIQVVRISDLEESGVSQADPVYYDESEDLKKYLIPNNAILVCLTGSIGKMTWVKDNTKRYLNQRVGMLLFKDERVIPYVWIFLHTPNVLNSWIAAKTSTNGNIKNSNVTELTIPLPPLAEQKAIVARVEELLKLVEEMKE